MQTFPHFSRPWKKVEVANSQAEFACKARPCG